MSGAHVLVSLHHRRWQVGSLSRLAACECKALHEHNFPGWTYLGTWFSVLSLGDFDSEDRFEVESYEALGSGFGDDEAQRLMREQSEQFIDYSTRPVTTISRLAGEIRIVKGM